MFFNNENGTTLIMKTIPPSAIVPNKLCYGLKGGFQL